MLENAAESPPSTARFVGTLFVLAELLLWFKRNESLVISTKIK